MSDFMDFFVITLIVIVVVGGACYIALGIFLNKLNKLMYGKGTPMAWIPVINIYLLGKLTISKVVGWLLVLCIFATGTVTTTINGVETTKTILPEDLNSILSKVYPIVILGLTIYAIVKYISLKKSSLPLTDQQIEAINQMNSQKTINETNNQQTPQPNINQSINNINQPQTQNNNINNNIM